MVELAYERAQLILGQPIEGQEVDGRFLDAIDDGLLDEGPDPMWFDPQGAANLRDFLAELAFRKGQLEAKSRPNEHHHCRQHASLRFGATDGCQRVVYVAYQTGFRRTHE